MGLGIGGNKSQRCTFSHGGFEATEECSVASYKCYLAAVWQNFVPVRGGCCVEKSEQSNAPLQRDALPVLEVLGVLCWAHAAWFGESNVPLLMSSGACTESTELDHRCRGSCLAEGPVQGHHCSLGPTIEQWCLLVMPRSVFHGLYYFHGWKDTFLMGTHSWLCFMACISLLLLWHWSCISFSHPLPVQGEAVIMTGLLVLCHRNWV